MHAFSPETLSATPTSLSAHARNRMLTVSGEPFLFSRWKHAVFIHFEVDALVLQREVPFKLDLFAGKAYVSLVAFYLQKMRVRMGGKVAEILMTPIGTHEFLNIRTYVQHQGEPGIYFLAEYLPNFLSLLLGPRLYGLPYRIGTHNYRHTGNGFIHGEVRDGGALLRYSAEFNETAPFIPAQSGTLDEFLLERYSAFTYRKETRRVFRVWHPPWPCHVLRPRLNETSLLARTGAWSETAQLIGGHYSPGFENVWMSRPKTLSRNPSYHHIPDLSN